MSKPELGVALTKELCVVCNKEFDGDIVMNTRLTKSMAAKVEEMHGKVTGFTDKPCKECLEAVGDGVYIIEVDEKLTEDESNPWRTGKQWGLSKDFILRIFNNDDMRKTTLEKQACYMPIDVCDMLGLPKE
jgi:hypothetical protein